MITLMELLNLRSIARLQPLEKVSRGLVPEWCLERRDGFVFVSPAGLVAMREREDILNEFETRQD